jgi:hypothetical protein
VLGLRNESYPDDDSKLMWVSAANSVFQGRKHGAFLTS